MRERERKLVGTLLILMSIVVIAGLGTAIYLVWLTSLTPSLLIVFFAVAGMAWIVPAMVIIRWMSRPDAPR